MRNLKRALSLTLASVMLLGMMVVGSSAAAGYDDVADTDNVEAIEVLQAVEVMVGDERGFGPERPVNRAEMAVVMGKLLNLDYNYYEATCPFNDVYDWARGWVGACYANGIVSGRGEGVYDPGTTVTAVEAASMLMRALGYFKYQSDYASGFEVSTVLQANKIRLFDGVNSKTNEPLTRNQVAQMALNALKSGMVEPDGNALNFIDANGNVIATGGKVNYVFVTSNKTFATAISSVKASSMGSSNDSPIVELGEQLYDGKLKLTDTTDDFERPSRYWEYDAKAIGTYVKEELIRQEYTVKVTGRTLHDLLGSTTIKDYDLVVAIDGVDDSDVNTHVFNKSAMVRTNENGVGATGKGVLTQVFVDPDEGANGLITIAIINTYLAIAEEDFDDRTDDVDFRVYGIEPIPNFRDEYWKTANIKTGPTDESSVFKLELEDFPEVADVKDGDATLVTVAKGEVQTLAKPEILSTVQISSFKQGDWIVTGGTQYDFASAAEFEMDTLYDYTATDNAVVNLKDINYNVYLDKYGYAIGVEEVDRVDNYMFITGVDTNTVNRYAVQADASAIFLDGTMEAIKIDLKAARDLSDQATYEALVGKTNEDDVANVKGGSLINKWFTYSVGNDGVYEVVLVKDDVAVRENKARAGQFRTLTKSDNNINNTAVGPYTALGGTHGVDEIGRKSIALRGSDESNSPYYSVYGDDKSVYITAELENIMDANGLETYHVNIISGVDNVAVGIDEASIDVWSKDAAMAKNKPASGTTVATAYGSYVLFDDDGDIIGAVVVGEDSGATTNLVYTHKSSIESETDNNASGSSTKANSSKGDYTWTRKVVSNGEEVTLTEVGSGLSKLKSMNANTWYVVKYNAKGEVKNVYPAWDTVNYKGLISADAKNELNDVKRLEDQYVNDIEELNTATNENSLALYEVGPYNTSVDLRVGNTHILTTKPSVDNHTFYVKTETNTGVHQGFRVADDVKTVFIQTNNREESTIFESGYSRLEKIVDRLHDHAEIGTWAGTSGYHYELSAVMENGRAVVVVIRDLNGAGANFTYDRNRELRLYGNLFTAPNTVTGASNAVVTVGNQEVKPSGIGTDRFGSYTTYSIPQGSIVGIVDYDIDNVTPRFDYMTNMVYSDLNVRYLNRTITFTMPDYNAWIDGGREGTFRDSIYGTLGSGVPAGVTATFDGHNAGVRYEADYNTYMTIVISGLKADAKYEVSIGSPATVDNFAADANGVLTLRYLLNGNDMRNGYVTINHVKSTDGAVDPKPPVDPEAKDATVTVTKGLVNIKKDGKVISKITADFKMDTANMGVKTGDVLTIEPAEALDVKGAKDNGNGTFTVEETTVTISPKTGYIWHPLFRQYVDGDGNPTLVEWVSAMAVNSVAKRFSLARAAGDDLVDTDKGESKIDTNDLNWFFKAYQAGVRNFEFRTRLADGTVFVENVSIVGTKITVTYDKDKFTAEQYAEYLGVLDANVDDVVTVNPGTNVPPVESDTVKANLEDNGTISIGAYEADKKDPTEAEIKGAVIKALKKVEPTLTADQITIDLEKNEIKTPKNTYPLNPSFYNLYKITVGASVQYVGNGEEFTGLADWVNGVLAEKDLVSNTVVPVADGKFTFAGTKDAVYKIALHLDETDVGGLGNSYTVYYDTGKTGNDKFAGIGINYWVQADVALQIVGSGLTAGAEAKITVNDKDYTGTVDANGAVRINVPALKEYAKDDEGEYLTTVEFEVAGALYSVKLDGTTIATDLAGDDTVILNDTSKLTPGAVYIAKKSGVAADAVTVNDVPAGASFGTVTALITKAGGNVKNSTIELYTAYSVTQASGGKFTVADAEPKTQKLGVFTDDTAKLVAKGVKLTVTAADGNTLLVPNPAISADTPSKWTEADLGAAKFDVEGKVGKAVYTVTVNKDICGTEFVKGMSLVAPVDGTSTNEETGHVNSPLVIGAAGGREDGTVGIDLRAGRAYKLDVLDTSLFLPAKGTKLEADWKVVSDANDATAPIAKAMYENLKVSAEVTKDSEEDGTAGEITITVTPIANSEDGRWTGITLEGDAADNGLKGTVILSYQGMEIPVVVMIDAPADAPAAKSVTAMSFKAGTAGQKTNVTATADDPTKGTVGFSWTLDGVVQQLGEDGKLDLSALNLAAGVYTFSYNEWYEKDGVRSKVQNNDAVVVVFPETISLDPTTVTGAASGEVTINVTGLGDFTIESVTSGAEATAKAAAADDAKSITLTLVASGRTNLTVTLGAEGETAEYDPIEITVTVS